jgi:HAMP domain-containing protein
MSPEEIQEIKEYAATNLSYYTDALAEVNKQVPDLLAESRGNTGNLNRIVSNATSDELYKFAKALEEMADSLKRVERDRWEAKRNGITL